MGSSFGSSASPLCDPDGDVEESARSGGGVGYSVMRNQEPGTGSPPSPSAGSVSSAQKAYKVQKAAATLITTLSAKEHGRIGLETRSVYGAAILMPQLARSTGWPKYFTFLAVRSWIFLMVNVLLQGWLLYMISKEENVMDLFAGQPYLCDFGSSLQDCPGAPGCMGPGGTEITPARMYNFDTWNTRRFVRDSLMAMFPDKKEDIMHKVDPGEYGVESHWCRWLCCFIFMIAVMKDMILNFAMLDLLRTVPNEEESWITLVEEEAEESNGAVASSAAEQVKQPPSSTSDAAKAEGLKAKEPSPRDADKTVKLSFDTVILQVAGMPLKWKVITFLGVFLPKFMLWKLTAQTGVTFLMETSAIEDIIVNSMGLTFVLTVDEMLCETLMSESTLDLLGRLEDFGNDRPGADENHVMSEAELMATFRKAQVWTWANVAIRDISRFVPWKLLLTVALTFIFISDHYARYCTPVTSGGIPGISGFYISNKIVTPQSVSFTLMNAFFPDMAPVNVEGQNSWEMPEEVH